MTMNPEVKSKWVTRLRSGEYQQGTGYLNQDDLSGGREYCCLGILCEIAREEGIIPEPTLIEGSNVLDYGGENPDGPTTPNFRFGTQFPSKAVVEWAGLPSHDPIVSYEDDDWDGPVEETLSMLNDDGKTFNEIADLIESQL